MVEYASSRLKLVCASANRLPNTSDSSRQHGQHRPASRRRAMPSRRLQQAVGHAESGHLGRRADEQRDRRRRALIDIRQPHMERRGAELEGDAGQHEHHAETQQHRRCGRLEAA